MSSRNFSYSSADTDVRTLLKKVTDAIFNDADVAYFIDRTDDYIDARLAQIYTVPFTTTPPMIKTISCHLASFYVLRTLYMQSRTDDNDAWMTSFKRYALELLDDIVSGKILLIDSSGNALARKSARGIASSTEDYDPTFNEGAPENWSVDTGKT